MGQRTSLVMDNPNKFQGVWYEIARYGESPYPNNRLKYEFTYNELSEDTCPPIKSPHFNIIISIITSHRAEEKTTIQSPLSNNRLNIGNKEYLILFTDYLSWAFLSTQKQEDYLILGRKPFINIEDRALILAATDKLGVDSQKVLSFSEVLINHSIPPPDPIRYITY